MAKIARTNVSRQTSSIVVLEDDPGVAAALVSVLEDAGYRVVAAATVAEARSMLGRRKIDLLVADIMLGDGTAFEILETAKRRAVPYLLITGGIEATAQLESSSEFYLTKPFKIETLMSAIRRRMRSGNGARQSRVRI